MRLSSGRELPYDALLLAPGAEPIRLDVPGADLPHVFTLRTLDDCRAIIGALASRRRAIVVGAGFLGLEVAASLRTRGLDVTVVAPDEAPLGRVFGAELGAVIRTLHEGHGVGFRLGRTVRAITESDVTLDDGERLPADLVLVGIGVRPRIELAERAGLAVDRGILVDAELRTSDPHIYAAGDAARYPDPRGEGSLRIEHWVVAERQGQQAARNLLGAAQPYRSAPFFWTNQYDLPIAMVGQAERWDVVDVDGDLAARDCAVAYRRQGKTLAVVTLHRDRLSLLAESALERGDEAALRALVPSGREPA